jgi:RNA polymerase sigma-70 factor, ECF subfamily
LNDKPETIIRPIKIVERSASINTAKSFSAFYERTHLSLFRYLYGVTGGPQEEVEDLTADTFTKAWRARRSFQGDESAALAWLMKIGRRLVIDNYRRRKARPQPESEPPEEFPLDEPIPEETAVAGEVGQTLLMLLRNLPEQPREILVLRYLLGWQVNHIAAYLEISENSVSATIHRTLEKLRQQWPAQEK